MKKFFALMILAVGIVAPPPPDPYECYDERGNPKECSIEG